MGQSAAAIDDDNQPASSMKVGAICKEDAVTICADAKLADAAQTLAANRVDALVVIASAVQRPTAIGIITDREILHAALEHPGDFTNLRVIDILSRTPLVLNQDEDVDAAMRKLAAADVRFAPVLGTGGTLRGTVSRHELLSCSEGAPVRGQAKSTGPRR